jgi:hypothetical protein
VPTKVFLSWSGDLSRQIAEAIRKWLPTAIQSVAPYFTPSDIDKGAKWDNEISQELETSNFGIICLTPDNLSQPWILFESGALSKFLKKSNVCPILFNLEPADLKGPLAGFQATKFEKNDFKKLFSAINNACGDAKLSDMVLDEVFETNWPRLEKAIIEILSQHSKRPKNREDKSVTRGDREILEEILALSRQTSLSIQNSNFKGRSQAPLVRPAVDDLLAGLEVILASLSWENAQIPDLAVERVERSISYLLRHADIDREHQAQWERVRMLLMRGSSQASEKRLGDVLESELRKMRLRNIAAKNDDGERDK